MTIDWHEWHRAYDRPESPLAQRLAIVQRLIRDALDTARPGPVSLLSMCAGEARDIAGALADHRRRADVHGRVVELDPELAARAREHLPPTVDVVVGDAGISDVYEGAAPADVVLVCGVFGNISDDDMDHTIGTLPMLCAPGSVVIWTRHRRPPDATPGVRKLLAEVGFHEIEFVAPPESIFGIGAARFGGETQPFRPHVRLFDFVGFNARADACPRCGFTYAMTRREITPWMRSDVGAFVERFEQFGEPQVRTRPAPEVWSPLEYACHVRDVLRVQRERIVQAQHELEPAFAPMRRDERAVEDHYNEQDPRRVAEEVAQAGTALVGLLDGLDDEDWNRTGIYNYPTPQLRSVEWIAIHTVHELLHHRVDIGTLA
jgi:hypothetical protein